MRVKKRLTIKIDDMKLNIIAEINANGNNLGTISASLYVQNDPVRIAGGLNNVGMNQRALGMGDVA